MISGIWKLYGNNIKVGDAVTVLLLDGIQSSKIHFFDKQFDEAAVVLQLLSKKMIST
jgi:hypothetical protein